MFPAQNRLASTSSVHAESHTPKPLPRALFARVGEVEVRSTEGEGDRAPPNFIGLRTSRLTLGASLLGLSRFPAEVTPYELPHLLPCRRGPRRMQDSPHVLDRARQLLIDHHVVELRPVADLLLGQRHAAGNLGRVVAGA